MANVRIMDKSIGKERRLSTATCGSGSPLAVDFVNVTNVVTVASSVALQAALAAVSVPTIITLTTATTYSLDKAYTVSADLCIQVRLISIE